MADNLDDRNLGNPINAQSEDLLDELISTDEMATVTQNKKMKIWKYITIHNWTISASPGKNISWKA
jgi:hypothetical protein